MIGPPFRNAIHNTSSILTIILAIGHVGDAAQGTDFHDIQRKDHLYKCSDGALGRLGHKLRIQGAIVVPVDRRNGEPWTDVKGDADPPQIPLWTDPRDCAYRGNNVVHLAVRFMDLV